MRMNTIFLLLTAIFMIVFSGKSMAESENIKTERATFAGGCFWCMQPPFAKLDGVIDTDVGYTGGKRENPSYKQVASGATDHAEAIEIVFDPAKVSYETLLDIFWRNINPTQENGQFADRGKQYRTEIFYHSEEQKKLAEASKAKLEASGKFSEAIATKISQASTFFDAEEYHQDYYIKNPIRYKGYHVGSGRAAYIKKTWGKGE